MPQLTFARAPGRYGTSRNRATSRSSVSAVCDSSTAEAAICWR